MTDEYYMKMALKEAEKAFEEGEVPVGAIVVINDRIISRGYNMVEKLKDPTAHAEIIALTSAFNALGAKYLPDATLYVTVEPCLYVCRSPPLEQGWPDCMGSNQISRTGIMSTRMTAILSIPKPKC